MTFARAGGRRTYPCAHVASVEVGTPTNRAASAVVYRGVSKRPLVVIFSALVSAPRSYPSPRPPRRLCRETAQEPGVHRSASRCSGPGRGLGAQAPRELIGPLADADCSTPRASSIVSADFDAAQAGLAISRKPRIALYSHYAAARDASLAVRRPGPRASPRLPRQLQRGGNANGESRCGDQASAGHGRTPTSTSAILLPTTRRRLQLESAMGGTAGERTSPGRRADAH